MAGLASLFAAPSGGTSAYEGIKKGINDVFGSNAPIDLTGFKSAYTPPTYPTTPDNTSILGSGNFTIPANVNNSPTIGNAQAMDNTGLGSGRADTLDLGSLWGSTLLR